ncbi:hypothetical protein [Methylobacterium sp. R2-1]|uniref:hypothetical protein n=1 Tax=Methylobacterium sp. R2-1 TaxID=2587064 RepID=UPI001606F8BE|nr:hypothetical protein [Methylobacterium sp. R2-1]MBB2961875.1 hypothetical protein [Methylobacterium sp. R2-1]
MPWHVWDDLQACLDLSDDLRTALKRDLMADWGLNVRTGATADGIVAIAPHWMAAGLVGAAAAPGMTTSTSRSPISRRCSRPGPR